MPLPNPVPGLVVEEDGEETFVTVAPVTHSPPRNPTQAVEVPAATRQRLGLDAGRSWVVVSEINRFCRPGPDLRPTSASEERKYAYGMLTPGLFRQIKSGLLAWAKAQRLLTTRRQN